MGRFVQEINVYHLVSRGKLDLSDNMGLDDSFLIEAFEIRRVYNAITSPSAESICMGLQDGGESVRISLVFTFKLVTALFVWHYVSLWIPNNVSYI